MTKNQETHWTCANRLKAEGGNAKCCDCDKHDGCGNPNNTIEEIIEKFGKMAFHTQQEAKEWIRQALEQVRQEAITEEQNRILHEGYELIKWNKNKKNQWAGVIHANTTINAIQQILEIVREPLSGNNTR